MGRRKRMEMNAASQKMAIRPTIDVMFTWWKDYIGIHSAECSWAAVRQSSTINLLQSQPFSIDSVMGSQGEFSIRTDSTATPLGIQQLRFGYRLNGPKIELTTFTVIDKGLVEYQQEEAEAFCSSPEAAGSIAGILTVFSIIKAVYGLLNPQCELSLPGECKLAAQMIDNELVIDTVGPSLRIVALFEFKPKLQRVRISTERVRLEFSDSLIKSREFVVE